MAGTSLPAMFERLLSVLLAACCTATLMACIPGSSGRGPFPIPPASDRAPATPVARTSEIAGQWDIVSFQDHRPRRLNGMTRAAVADFRADGVRLMIECNSSGVSGEVRDGRFVARPGDRIQTLVGCGPVREARDAALFGFFERRPTVERLADGRLRLTAGADVLLLERPARRRLAFLPSPQQLLGGWRLLEISRYFDGGGLNMLGLSDVAGRIEFDGIGARYTPCPQYSLRYRYAPEGRIEKLAGPDIPNRRQGCEALREEFERRDIPTPWDVMRVLHADPLVELVDRETILLSTEEFGVLLTKRPPEG